MASSTVTTARDATPAIILQSLRVLMANYAQRCWTADVDVQQIEGFPAIESSMDVNTGDTTFEYAPGLVIGGKEVPAVRFTVPRAVVDHRVIIEMACLAGRAAISRHAGIYLHGRGVTADA